MSRSYVFLGPTLPLDEACEVFDAEYCPPVSLGDVCRLALQKDKPFAIGIVDGLFKDVPSVFHKEIMLAITKGIHVLGSSSMGALRAAELAAFGMVGVGRVYDAYKAGDLMDDDEVAITHSDAESGYKPLSDAMVDIRCTLHKAWEDAIITTRTRDALTDYAKGKFYPDRNFKDIINKCPVTERTELREFIKYHKVNQKKLDAIAMLKTMKALQEKGEPPQPHSFSLELTWPLESLILQSRSNDKGS